MLPHPLNFLVCTIISSLASAYSVAAWGYEEIEVKHGGTILGIVKFVGIPPVPEKVIITKDRAVCGNTTRFQETLEVAVNKGIKNVVVSIIHLPKGKKWGTPASLEQKKCRYTPHVVLSPVGAELTISNHDDILHHLVTESRRNLPIEKAHPPSDRNLKAKFVRPETIKVTCDIHRWMRGWLVIQPHPYYAVTDGAGNFEMTEVPPGTYELRFWHETLGEKIQAVSVTPNETLSVVVEMEHKRPGMTSLEGGNR